MSELFVDAARDWIAERRAVGRTISAETAKAYRADLASWQRYLEAQLGSPVRVQDLTSPVIKAALAEMNNAGLAPASRRRLVTVSLYPPIPARMRKSRSVRSDSCWRLTRMVSWR